MKALHESATPDDGPDMNAIIPAGAFRQFVDDNAKLMHLIHVSPHELPVCDSVQVDGSGKFAPQPAQVQQAEPVAWVDERAIGWLEGRGKTASITTQLQAHKSPERPMPLYAAPQPAHVHGWQLVPVEPTPKMLAAVVTSLDEHMLGWHEASQQYREDWAAMLAAAPQQGDKT